MADRGSELWQEPTDAGGRDWTLRLGRSSIHRSKPLEIEHGQSTGAWSSRNVVIGGAGGVSKAAVVTGKLHQSLRRVVLLPPVANQDPRDRARSSRAENADLVQLVENDEVENDVRP